MIDVALIGAGCWGSRIVDPIRGSGRFHLAAVCDSDPRLGHLPDGMPVLHDWHQAATSCQAVLIATPPGTHASLCHEALYAGKHVLCEKPLALSSSECAALDSEARRLGLTLLVDCLPVYLDEVRNQKGALRDAALVLCRRVSSREPPGGPGPLWDLAVHDLALLRHTVGPLPAGWVLRRRVGLDVLEACYPGGPAVEVQVGYGPVGVREVSAFWRGGRHLTFHQEQMLPGPLHSVLAHFADCIEKGEAPLTGASWGMEVARAIEEALCRS